MLSLDSDSFQLALDKFSSLIITSGAGNRQTFHFLKPVEQSPVKLFTLSWINGQGNGMLINFLIILSF